MEKRPAGAFMQITRNKLVPTTALTEWVPGMRTRMCTTLLYGNDGGMTELIDPSEKIPMHHVGDDAAHGGDAATRDSSRVIWDLSTRCGLIFVR